MPRPESRSEQELKAALLTKLYIGRRIGRETVLANEYRLGNSGIRADIAILGKEFIGIEVKSERDSLRRFPSQLDAYKKYFDRVIILLAEKHLLRTPSIVSDVELWVEAKGGKILKVHSQPKTVKKNLELLDLLEKNGRERFNLEINYHPTRIQVRSYFESKFRAKFAYSSSLFWRAVDTGKITKEDLKHLSSYLHEKDRLDAARSIKMQEILSWERKH